MERHSYLAMGQGSNVARERLRQTPWKYRRETHFRMDYDYRLLGQIGIHMIETRIFAILHADPNQDN